MDEGSRTSSGAQVADSCSVLADVPKLPGAYLDALNELLRDLPEFEGPEMWPAALIRRLAEAVKADFGAIVRVDEGASGLDHAYVWGFPTGNVWLGEKVEEKGVIGRALRGEIVSIPDMRTEKDSLALRTCYPRIGPCLALPVRAFGKVAGAAVLGRLPGAAPFAPEDAGLAMAFCFYVAIAMGEMCRAASVERERGFFSKVLEALDALVVVFDTSGKIVRFNRGCHKATGYCEEEVKGCKSWEDFVPSEERESVREVFEALRAGEEGSRHVNHWVARDGRRRLISWSNTTIRALSGAVEFVVGTGLDLTDLVAAQKAAQAERERVETALCEVSEAKRRLETLLTFAVDREKRVVELKAEANALLRAAGKPEKYRAPGPPEVDHGESHSPRPS